MVARRRRGIPTFELAQFLCNTGEKLVRIVQSTSRHDPGGRGPTADLTSSAGQAYAALVDALRYVLPDLSAYTRTEWLIYAEPQRAELEFVAVQTVIYVALILAIGVFDLYRRNF